MAHKAQTERIGSSKSREREKQSDENVAITESQNPFITLQFQFQLKLTSEYTHNHTIILLRRVTAVKGDRIRITRPTRRGYEIGGHSWCESERE
jgi:hypothetical protein